MFLRLGAKKSFTLIELVIVLVIVAILVALALPRFTGVRRRAYRVEAIQILNEIKNLAWARNLECGGVPVPNDPATSTAYWPTGWADMGYVAAPSTANWDWTTTVPTWGPGACNTAAGAPVAGATIVFTATPVANTPAAGQVNVVLTIRADGTSILQ